MHRYAVLLLPLLVLASCASPQPAGQAPGPEPTPVVVEPAYGFAIGVPAGMHADQDFRSGYLGNGSWKAFASHDRHGTPVLTLVLDGSNAITTAALRIGVGDDAVARAQCLDVPSSGVPAQATTVTLAGVPFTRFRAADAAMSHYLDVDSYRAVHDGRCYAIDLLVSGTRPEVYDPPATPPFKPDAAWQRLRDALAGFRFL